MDDLDSTHFDDDTKGFSLIDVSASDDDFLFVSSSEANPVDNQVDIFAKEAHIDKPSDLLAVQRPRKPGKCNMRKSLAWDSAFFTSAGVLDAEELSSIMEGAGAGLNQNHQLPEIQEELSKSTDSITTFESDSLTLESLEADLFCDIRASIQRSSKTSNSANNHGRGESGNGCSRKIGQPSSGNMVKPKLASRKLTPAVQGPVRMLKPTSTSKQVTKPVIRDRELSSALPQSPAATGISSPEGTAASKKTSVGTSHAQSELNHAGNIRGAGKETLISKGPRRVDSRTTLQKSLASSKFSSASSVFNKTAIRGSHSSYDSSGSSSTTTKSYPQNDLGSASSRSSSENIRKSQLDVRKKIDKNANLPPGSKIRTPSRLPVKSKSRPGESHLSAYVKSTSKLSPSVSPASSISEWSTESSSSTTTVNQKHSGLKHGSTHEDVIADSNVSQNMLKDSNDRSLGRHDYQVASMLSESTKQPPTGPAASLPRTGSAKPSGLRLPSPKIGFFDGAKAGTKTPSGSARSRSALPSNLSKPAAGNHSPSEPANKSKPGSNAIKVSTSEARATKPDPHKSLASPKLTRQRQDQSVNLQSGNDFGTFSEVLKNTLPKSPLERISVVAKGVNGEEHIAVSGLDAKNHSTCLQKASLCMIANDGSDTSIELPESTSTNSASESSEVSDEVGGKHFSEASFTGKDHVEAVRKTSSVPPFDGEPEPNTKLLKCHSPEIGSDSKVAEVMEGGEKPDDLQSPNLTKELEDHSVGLQKGDSSARFSEVSKTTEAKSPFERISVVAKAADVGKHVAVSDTYMELSESTSTNSALERSSKASDEVGGKHFSELSFTGKDLLLAVLKTSSVPPFADEPETNTQLLRCHSPEIGSDNKVAEVKEGGENQDDLRSPNLTKELEDHSAGLQTGDYSACFSEVSKPTEAKSPLERISIVGKAADGGKRVTDSDTSIELSESTLTNSALESSEVSDEVGGKCFSEVSFTGKDLTQAALKTSSVPPFNDEPETNTELLGGHSTEIGSDGKVAEVTGGENPDDLRSPNLTKELEDQKAPVSMFVNDDSGTSIELPKSTSTNSALKRSSEVSEETDGGKQEAEASFISVEVLKTSSVPNFDDESETNSELLRCSSLEIGRDSKVAEVKRGREHSDDSGSACKDDFVALKDASEERKLQSTVDQPCDVADDIGVSQGSGIPFAVENYVSDVVETSNSSTVAASEVFDKIDAGSSLENGQNENS